MPETDSPANSLLQALGFALFVREKSGALRSVANAPGWLIELWPALAESRHSFDPAVSPFLENFLVDAEECWRAGGEKRASSGPWVEQDSRGGSVSLEATALTLEDQSVLLLERLGEAFETKKAMLQKARENVIAYQRLNSEIQKKEILLHCVADEMTAALANVITSLRLLELENNSPRSKVLLGLATRATEEQQALIHRVLEVFAEELGGLYGQGEAENEADVAAAIAISIQALAAQAEEKKIRLTSPTAAAAKVSLDPRHLERVLANLIENALERSVSGGEITITARAEEDSVLVAVDDTGSAAPSDACENLFSQLEPAANLPNPTALRLHFCRMMAADCGGEIGCEARERGNRFWIRLPKISA